MNTQLPTDDQVIQALKHKKDVFTSRFIKHNELPHWSSTNEWYFSHVCTVLNHAVKLFQADVDDLVNTNIELHDK
jgi:hypothetical protein